MIKENAPGAAVDVPEPIVLHLTAKYGGVLSEVARSIGCAPADLVSSWLVGRLRDEPYGAHKLAQALYVATGYDDYLDDAEIAQDLKLMVTAGAVHVAIAYSPGCGSVRGGVAPVHHRCF